MEFNQILKEVNNPRLRASIQQLSNTPQGRQLVQKLQGVDQAQINKFVKSINSNSIPTEAIIKQIENNPNIIRQINNMLK